MNTGSSPFPEVEGKRTVCAIRRGAVHDPQLGHAFLRVAQLIDEPSALLTPRLALRTLRASWAAATERPIEVAQCTSFAG